MQDTIFILGHSVPQAEPAQAVSRTQSAESPHREEVVLSETAWQSPPETASRLRFSVTTVLVPEGMEKELADLARFARCYFPCLPRMLEHAVQDGQLRVVQPSLAGERLDRYLQRLGPIVLETSCAIVWRLACELTQALRVFPGIASWLDFSEARMHLWHRDCLLLTLPCVAARPGSGNADAQGEVRLVRELTKLLGRLMGVGSNIEAHPQLARRLPTEVLRLFQPKAEGYKQDSPDSPLVDFAKQLHLGLALFTRKKDVGSLAGLFRVPSRLLPQDGEVPEYDAPSAAELLPESGRMAVSLVQLMMRRQQLTSGEIRVLRHAIEVALESDSQGSSRCLDPMNIYLLFNLNGGSLERRKDLLDTRLLADIGLKVHLHAPGEPFDPLRSLVMARSGQKAGRPCAVYGRDVRRQLSRLTDVLRSGCYSLSAYSADAIQPKVRFAASRQPRMPNGASAAEPLLSVLELLRHVSPPTVVVPAREQVSAEPPIAAPEPEVDPEVFPQENSEPVVSALDQCQQVENYNAPGPSAAQELLPTALPMHESSDHAPVANKRLVITTVGSGGIGKSTIARLLFELADLRNHNHVAMFDCDASGNRDFQRVAPHRVEASPVHDVETIRRMISSALEQNLVIADLPASCHDVVLRDLTPDIIRDLREEDNIEWVPVFPVTAKASTIPAIHQWRKLIFGDAPAILVVNLKDGPVTLDMIESVRQPNDTVVKMPLLDSALAAAVDAVGGIWGDICEGRTAQEQRLFTNPLVRRQLRTKLREMEIAFAPLIARIKSVLPASENA